MKSSCVTLPEETTTLIGFQEEVSTQSQLFKKKARLARPNICMRNFFWWLSRHQKVDSAKKKNQKHIGLHDCGTDSQLTRLATMQGSPQQMVQVNCMFSPTIARLRVCAWRADISLTHEWKVWAFELHSEIDSSEALQWDISYFGRFTWYLNAIELHARFPSIIDKASAFGFKYDLSRHGSWRPSLPERKTWPRAQMEIFFLCCACNWLTTRNSQKQEEDWRCKQHMASYMIRLYTTWASSYYEPAGVYW